MPTTEAALVLTRFVLLVSVALGLGFAAALVWAYHHGRNR
jgi:hypothetical protein